MALTPGTRIGPYEVLSSLGAGGMGEVYRARDAKLNRDVALKILSAAFLNDADRLARFHREAQLLASLNHPNIAAIHGFEDSGAMHALVLELVEGPTLADRIALASAPGSKDSGLQTAEVLSIARQIADALECAHEGGIVHRDLKPANVKVRDDGAVKVLDFGLAKAIEPASAASDGAMNSPTLTARATQLGVILGTAAYMAPEQAKGKAVDKRADIWAFGCVLFEMLSGQRPFKGEDISDTLASVLRQDIDWALLPDSTPAPLRRLVARCLDRDVKQRLRDIGEARIELARIEAGTADNTIGGAGPAAPVLVTFWKRAVPWILTGVTAAAIAIALVMWSPWRVSPPPPTVRLTTEIGAEASLNVIVGASTVISLDGRMLAFTAVGAAGPQLFLRHLDQLNATPLLGTAGAYGPFFSPNGRSIGFFNGSRLMKISTDGGAASPICPAPAGRGGTWADDDTIYFQPTTVGPLMRVAASGGTPVVVAGFAEGEGTQRWPQALPGGKAVLYTGNNQGTGWEDARVMIQPLPSGTPKVLLTGGFHGRYLASGRNGGYILYIRRGTIFAVAFDLTRLEVTGQPVAVLEGVVASANNGGAQFSVSAGGTLVYAAGKGSDSRRAMFWMDSAGATVPLRAEETDWLEPRFAPSGKRLAVAVSDGAQLDLWLYDWMRDTPTKFTFDTASDRYPVWTPDEKRLAFGSDRGKRGTNNLYWQRTDGSGGVQRLTDSANSQTPFSFDPTGKFLAYAEVTANNSSDLMILPLEGDEARGWKPGTPFVFLSTPATETGPMFSFDGKWIAYMSDESTLVQTYVRPFRGPGGKQLVSASGVGVYPTWSRTRPELFFQDPIATLFMVVPFVATADSFQPSKPRAWGPGKYLQEGTSRVYDLHPDGKRVMLGKPPDDASQKRGTVVLVLNFAEEIARLMAAAR